MNKRLVAGILLLMMNAYLMGICEGDFIPGFRVESGDFKMLNNQELSHKVIFFFMIIELLFREIMYLKSIFFWNMKP